MKQIMMRLVDGVVPVDALETPTPGLVVTACDVGEGLYCLTHESSGMAVIAASATHDVFGLMRLAERLADLGNWSESPAHLHATIDRATFSQMVRDAPVTWVSLGESAEVDKVSRETLRSMGVSIEDAQ